VWLSKSNYTEVELCDIHDLNKVLSVIKFRGHVTDQLSAQIDDIAGNWQLCIGLCIVCLYFIALLAGKTLLVLHCSISGYCLC